jgi:spermidine synthase
MECNDLAFENVFVIGHGIGTISRHYPEKWFKVAEIDEKVVVFNSNSNSLSTGLSH